MTNIGDELYYHHHISRELIKIMVVDKYIRTDIIWYSVKGYLPTDTTFWLSSIQVKTQCYPICKRATK